MQFTTDTRAVSEVIGAILVFGLLIALLAIMQTQAVPAANERVEFEHSQGVQSDLTKFHEAASRVAATGTPESARVQMGTTYPTRLLFFNPRNPSGELRVAGNQTATIHNIRAVDSHIDDYINNNITGLQTKRLEYRPNYNEYDHPPVMVLEYGAVYRDYGDQVTIDDPGQVISGNSISLTFFNGDMARTTGGSMSLEAQATSSPARTVTVEPNDNDEPIILEIPSNLNASQWEDILEDESNVEAVGETTDGMVGIALNETETYTLRMAQIGIGSGVPTPEATYVARADNRQLQFGEATRLPIEVRDRYNNPVSGESINLSVSNGGFENGTQTIESTTTEDGQPSALYSGSDEGVVELEASFVREPSDPSFDPDDNKEDIRFNVTFDPRSDQIDPVIRQADLSEDDYSVCGNFGDESLPVVGDLLRCLNTTSASQLIVDYNVTDTGGAGLDYIELTLIGSDGDVLLMTTESLRGSQDDGVFRSPQIRADETGVPESVELTVFDRNGNADSASGNI